MGKKSCEITCLPPLKCCATTGENQPVDISSSSPLQIGFSFQSLLGFWNVVKSEYPGVCGKRNAYSSNSAASKSRELWIIKPLLALITYMYIFF